MRIEQRILHTYPVGQKFRRNRSISNGSGDTSNFKFYHKLIFLSKITKFKMAAIFGERKYFWN